MTCNLKSEEGKALLRRMIGKADVLIENMAPGTFARLGFDYPRLSALNPRLIFAQVKGFAPESEHANYLAFDMIAQAMGGTMGVNGFPDQPPVRPGSTIGDTGTGMLCAMGILAALYQRMTTGRGQHIQIAMRDAMLNYCRTPMSRQAAREDQLPRGGNTVFGTAPGGLYKCSPGGLDDWCYIFASRGNEEHWRRLVKAIGREDLLNDPRMVDGAIRAQNREAVDAAITEWTSKRTKHEVTRIIAGAGVPCGAVLTTLELMHDPDLHQARDDAEDRASGARAGHRGGLAAADVGQQGPAEMRPNSRRGFRGDLWRVARLLPRRGQGHAARQGDLRTAILPREEPLPPRASRMNAKRVRMSVPGQSETSRHFRAESVCHPTSDIGARHRQVRGSKPRHTGNDRYA